jgi:aminopeptidase YwaD
MDPVYNYNVAKATIGAMMHFAQASTTLSNSGFDNDFQVSFYPNPTKDFLTINSGILEGKYTFSMIDLQGKVVFNKTIDSPNQLEKIDVSSFNKSMYLCVLENEKHRITKKIVIE